MVQDEQEKWDIVIKPRSGLFRLDLEEVWLYRDLLVMYISWWYPCPSLYLA